MTIDKIVIEEISAVTEAAIKEVLRRNLEGFEEAGSVIASTFRRLTKLQEVYSNEGARYFVLRDTVTPGICLGGAGIGPFHGLPVSEGLGEVRDLVLDKVYRGQGLGARLLKRCVDEAKSLGYRSLYLETTPQMENAQKLFVRFGFRPVTMAQAGIEPKSDTRVPSYFILEKL